MMDIQEAIKRITEAEEIFDRTEAVLGSPEPDKTAFLAIQPEIKRLSDYYESPEWKRDFELDERGLLPAGLKRGVLSEDGIYDLLEKNREMTEEFGRPPKIIIIKKHTEKSLEKFRSIPGCCVICSEKAEDIPQSELEDAEIFVGEITPELLLRMPRLRYVQLFSAGADGFEWLPEKIMLANAYGAYGDSIAEHMLTTTLMAMKRMPEYLQMQKDRRWELLQDICRFEGSKILSVGMGAIGTSYLRRAAAMGAVCYGVRRTVHDRPDYVRELVTPDEMDKLLPEMDVVALSLPGTEETKGMFDERRLRLMKKTAILINAGRGNSVVTEDLVRVMESGHLKAACLDVMDPEPLPEEHPLWTAPRVYITPHISGGYHAGFNYDRVVDTAIANIKLVLEGKQPVHVVNRKLGY